MFPSPQTALALRQHVDTHQTAIVLTNIPYKNKYWRGTKFGESANGHAIAKFKSRQYIFFYSISVVTLVAFERFHQINISPNPLFQQIAKYYIRQYLFLYGICGQTWGKHLSTCAYKHFKHLF